MPKPKQRAARRLLIVLLVLPGCGAYDKVGLLAYEQVKSLYTVCNQKNAEQLERAAEKIAEAHEVGKLSSQEVEWLEAIIADARSGQWKVAATKCRRLMEAQVEH